MESHMLKTIKKYEIVTCDSCGFLYIKNPPGSTTADNSTSDLRHSEVPQPKRRHHYIHNLIEQLDTGNQIIEIGSGFGALGKLLTNNSYDYLGFEPDEGRANIAADGGVPVQSSVFGPSEISGSVDAVVIDNVLEHVHDPQSIIDDAANVLSDTGHLIIVVPNRYDIRRLHPGWSRSHFWIPPAHINFFRWTDLKAMCSSAGVSIRPFPVRSHLTEDLHTKDIGFIFKLIVEKSGITPLGLYAYGSLSD
ncbi:class I SAM-dependent methyltransferase [Halorubrum sp. FL23]